MLHIVRLLARNCIVLFPVASLGGSFFIFLAGRKRKRLPELTTLLVSGGLLAVALMVLMRVYRGGALIHNAGGWVLPFGIALVVDGFSAFMLVTVNLIAFLVALYSVGYMKQYTAQWKFFSLFLLMLGGMNGVLVTGDIFNLYVFLEIAALSSYVLVAFGTGEEELEASFKYMVMGCLASSFILLGIVLLYSFTSTLNMADMSRRLAGMESGPLVYFVTALFLAGFGLKAAIVPFHAWLPDAHSSAPAPISAMLSGVLIKTLGIYALVRIFFSVIGAGPELLTVLMVLGALSMVVGVLLAVGQWDFKRLLAYHSISQVGYVILGFGLGTPLGILGGLFHLFNHSLFKSLLFLNSGAVDYATGTRNLKEMGGLKERMPVTGVTSLMASMSISGVPFFNGFWSKLIIVIACVQGGHYVYGFLASLVSLITLASFMKVQRYAFYGKLAERWRGIREVPFTMQCAMIVMALLCVAGGILLIPPLSAPFLQQAREAVLHGTRYADTVFDLLKVNGQ
jgi:multicomponent Na+:H+ antiporter subunit D